MVYKTFGPPKLEEGLFDVKDFIYLTKTWNRQFLEKYSATEQEILSKLRQDTVGKAM
jgi:hypothetical protein